MPAGLGALDSLAEAAGRHPGVHVTGVRRLFGREEAVASGGGMVGLIGKGSALWTVSAVI